MNSEDINFLSKFLWYWNPEKSNIWFIWMEEWWNVKDKKSFTEYLSSIQKFLNKTESYFYLDFLNSFKDNEKNNVNPTWQKYLEILNFESTKEFEKIFLWEMYFLPFINRDNQKEIFKIVYWMDFDKFYRDNLTILENRLIYLKKIILQSKNKRIYFWVYSYLSYDIINKVFKWDFSPLNKNTNLQKKEIWNNILYFWPQINHIQNEYILKLKKDFNN